MWTARIERSFSAAHHNGPPGHRCLTNHGHDFRAIVEIDYTDVDPTTGWGPDFGIVKKIIDDLDHEDLNVEFSFPPSSEFVAMHLYHKIFQAFDGKYKVSFVQIFEGSGNSVTYRE